MKKNLFPACAAMLMLAGCQNEDFTMESQQKAQTIGINVYQKGLTKATETTITTLQQDGFTLDAVSTAEESEFSFTDEVEYNAEGKSWNFFAGANHYWPLNEQEELVFTAVAPTSLLAETDPFIHDTTGNRPSTTINFASNDYPLDEDIVVSQGQKSGEELTLNFNHIMSQVAFEINFTGTSKCPNANLVSLKIKGAKSTQYDMANSTWKTDATATNQQTYTLFSGGQSLYNATPHAIPTSTDEQLYVLPQVYDLEMNVVFLSSEWSTVSDMLYTGELDLSQLKGKKAVVKLSVTGEKTPIGLKVEVANWETSNGVELSDEEGLEGENQRP